MKKLEGIRITRILINAVIVASVIIALTSGFKIGGN
jgi:hypothetical protein